MAEQSRTSLTDPLEARHGIEQRGVALARELGIDQSSFQVASNLHWTFTLMKALFERGPLAEERLSMSGFVALWALRVSGEMEGREVAAEVGIARSSFSGLANRLEQRGLIQRRQSPNDGRAVLFSLTEQGRVVLERVWPELNRCEQQLSEHLGPDGRRELADALRSVADQLTTLLRDEAAAGG
ncbi:MAG: MarR family transcriptional regulator [Acidimicrobiaceae bacterium]|nr:MarR family transcriptional regulator [Acidimicrobiaceae bacterium]